MNDSESRVSDISAVAVKVTSGMGMGCTCTDSIWEVVSEIAAYLSEGAAYLVLTLDGSD